MLEVDRVVGDVIVDELVEFGSQFGCAERAELTVELDDGMEPPVVGGDGDPGSQL